MGGVVFKFILLGTIVLVIGISADRASVLAVDDMGLAARTYTSYGVGSFARLVFLRFRVSVLRVVPCPPRTNVRVICL